MSFLSHTATPSGLILATNSGRVRLEPWTDTNLRVTCTTRPAFLERPSRMLVPRSGQPPQWQGDDRGEALCLETPALRLEIDRAMEAFTWRDAPGGRVATRRAHA